MMNRTIAASLAILAAAGAQAQNLNLYGVIDTAVERLNHVGAEGEDLTRLPSLSGTMPSSWGVRGSEDLGGGLRAVFTLESGFAPDTGALNQGGRIFGRQAWVGLAGNWGTLSLGRQYNMYFWSLTGANVLASNLYGLSSLDPYIPAARFDNAIAYRGTFGGLTVGGIFSLGRDAVGGCAGESAADSDACHAASVLVKYDAATWGSALAVDKQRGGTGAGAGLVRSSLSDRRISFNGYRTFGALKLGAGLVRRDNEGSVATPESRLLYAGAAYTVTPLLVLDAMVANLDYRNSDNEAKLVAARATYYLSKRTAIYGTGGHISNDGTLAVSVSTGQPGGAPAAGATQTGFAVGVRHHF